MKMFKNNTRFIAPLLSVILVFTLVLSIAPLKAYAALYGNGTEVIESTQTSASFSFNVPQDFGNGTLYVRALSTNVSNLANKYATFTIKRNGVQVWQDMIKMDGSDYSALVSGWKGGTYVVTFSFPVNSADLSLAASVEY